MRYVLSLAAATLAIAALVVPAPARAEDPIVGTWTGKLTQPDNEPFEMTAEMNVTPGGRMSVPATDVAAAGPRLVIVIV